MVSVFWNRHNRELYKLKTFAPIASNRHLLNVLINISWQLDYANRKPLIYIFCCPLRRDTNHSLRQFVGVEMMVTVQWMGFLTMSSSAAWKYCWQPTGEIFQDLPSNSKFISTTKHHIVSLFSAVFHKMVQVSHTKSNRTQVTIERLFQVKQNTLKLWEPFRTSDNISTQQKNRNYFLRSQYPAVNWRLAFMLNLPESFRLPHRFGERASDASCMTWREKIL